MTQSGPLAMQVEGPAVICSLHMHYALPSGLDIIVAQDTIWDIPTRNPKQAAPKHAPPLPSLQKLLSNADTLQVIRTRLVSIIYVAKLSNHDSFYCAHGFLGWKILSN